jgi:L-fuculose-phosphate aldolase
MLVNTKIRRALAELGKSLREDGYIKDLQGNFSVYDRKNGIVYITPAAIPYALRGPEDICLVDIDGKILDGLRKPSSEMTLHLELYRTREDISAIVHTHPANAGVFAIAREPIPQVLESDAMGFSGPVPVAAFAPHGTAELAKNVSLAMLPAKKACVIANHGLVTAADTIEKAVHEMRMIEDAAKMILLARAAGMKVNAL